LHDVLKSSPEDLARNLNGIADDPFFSEEDYALMDPGIPVDDEDDSESSEEMEAMYVSISPASFFTTYCTVSNSRFPSPSSLGCYGC
jgi:hypothetical protein